MKPYQVYFIEPKVDIAEIMQPDVYKFVPTSPWKVLQKQMWKFLLHTKAITNATYDHKKVTWHTVEPDNVVKYVLKQIDHCWDRYSLEPTSILMGSEDYRKIASGVEEGVEFQMAAELRQSNTFLGIKVHVVPWIKGIIVLPKGFK